MINRKTLEKRGQKVRQRAYRQVLSLKALEEHPSPPKNRKREAVLGITTAEDWAAQNLG